MTDSFAADIPEENSAAGPPALPYDDLIWVCDNLCQLLEVENDALARHDSETVRALAENKQALARIYERSVGPMADDPSLVDALEPDQKEELRAWGGRLAQLVTDNVRMLQAEMQCCQRLMDSIVSAVKSQAANSVSYSREGNFDILHKTGERTAIALNKTF